MSLGAFIADISLLYELTSGLVIAHIALMCSIIPPINHLASLLDSLPLSTVLNIFLPFLYTIKFRCIPDPSTPCFGFGINVACNPNLVAVERTADFKVIIESAICKGSASLKSISCCAGAFS